MESQVRDHREILFLNLDVVLPLPDQSTRRRLVKLVGSEILLSRSNSDLSVLLSASMAALN